MTPDDPLYLYKNYLKVFECQQNYLSTKNPMFVWEAIRAWCDTDPNCAIPESDRATFPKWIADYLARCASELCALPPKLDGGDLAQSIAHALDLRTRGGKPLPRQKANLEIRQRAILRFHQIAFSSSKPLGDVREEVAVEFSVTSDAIEKWLRQYAKDQGFSGEQYTKLLEETRPS